MKRLEIKLKMLWLVITARALHLTFQRKGGAPQTIAYGGSTLRDLVLFAKEMKDDHDSLLNIINQMAAEAGELHNLKELQDAIEVINGGQ